MVRSNDDPGVTLTYFMARSDLVTYGKMGKQWIFKNYRRQWPENLLMQITN